MSRIVLLKLFIPFVLVFSGWVQAASPYSQLFVFGDSLSDTGNLASVAGDFPSPPFYNNRVSNGPVTVEILANKLGLTAQASLHLVGPQIGTNYAVAGANAAGIEGIDLPAQTVIFLANNGGIAPADALYVVMIGGNDIRSARGLADTDQANAVIDAAVDQVMQSINQLALAGARSFLLVSAPDIGVIPETQILALLNNDPGMVKRASKLSKRFRKQLKRAGKALEEDADLEITLFDLLGFFNELLEEADEQGFTNTTEACFSSISFSFNPGCNFGLNFDQYIFFDEIHPTARVHAIVGEAAFEALDLDESEDEDEDEDEDELKQASGL